MVRKVDNRHKQCFHTTGEICVHLLMIFHQHQAISAYNNSPRSQTKNAFKEIHGNGWSERMRLMHIQHSNKSSLFQMNYISRLVDETVDTVCCILLPCQQSPLSHMAEYHVPPKRQPPPSGIGRVQYTSVRSFACLTSSMLWYFI